MNRLIFFFVIVFLCSIGLPAQDKKKNCCSDAVDSLMKVLPTQKEDSSKVKTLLAIAWNKFNLTWSVGGDYESAIDFAKQGLALAEKVNFKWGKGRSNFILGMCWNGEANYTESLKYHFAALKISFENKNKELTINEYYHIGKAYNMLGNYNEALKNYFEELKVIKETNKDSYYADCYAGIGNVYLNMENYTQADQYFANAYSLAAKKQIKPLMGEMLIYEGNSLLGQKKYDDALNKYTSALIIFQEYPSKSRLASIYYGIAKVCCKKASLEQDSLSRQQYYLKAILYFNKSLALDKEIDFKNGISNVYSGLAEAYRGINDYKNALIFSDSYTQLRDSSYNKSAYVKIAELKIQYETEKAGVAMKAQQEKERIEEDALRARMLADQKLKQEKIIADEKVAYEKDIAGQKLEQERKIAAEKVKYEKSIALEKARQEKIRAEKQQMNNLLLMGLLLAVITFVFLILLFRQRNLKKRAVEKAEAVHKIAELEMQSLRSQLNPHFIFNSLNSIQTLILKEEADKSQSYLSQFARLLRILLENAENPFISLRKEIDFLQLYLGLESLRVPDLQYSISTEPALNSEQTLIPNMFLQPYVENAIWHGLSHKETNKQLQNPYLPRK